MKLRLFPTLEAPGEARRGVAALADRIDQASLSDLKVVISELVTISVAHGATKPIEMSLKLIDGELEGVVDDQGPGARAIVRAREHRDSSLVLRIVDRLVEEWGTDRGETRIWFRMRVQPLAD